MKSHLPMKSDLRWCRRGRQIEGQGTVRFRGGPRRGVRPEVLALEGRQMLSTVIPVTSSVDTGAGTLRAAIVAADAATVPVTIDFELPTPATITLTQGPLELSGDAPSITIDGPGSDQLTISGVGASGIFQVEPGVSATISGCSLVDGLANVGGAVDNSGNLTLSGCQLEGSASKPYMVDNAGLVFVSPGAGGAINNGSGGTLCLTDCTLTGNSSAGGGGAINNDGTATLTGCSLSGDIAPSGGAIDNSGSLALSRCQLDDNTAPPLNFSYDGLGGSGPGTGGASSNSNGTVSLVDCTVTGNTSNFGGAIADEDYGGTSNLSLTGCTLSGNSAVVYQTRFGDEGPVGGAIESENNYGQTTIALTGCTISGNTAGGAGTFGYGGALNIAAFSGNPYQTDLTITDCTLSTNSTTGFGGAVASYYAKMTMEGCTVSGNSAAAGGGVSAAGASTLTDCTISGNTAGVGGGVQAYGAGALSLVAATISGNTATDGAAAGNPGGGIYGATFDGNTPTASLADTIIAGNDGPGGRASDIAGVAGFEVTGSYNLIGTGGSGGLLAANHNLLNVADPGLAPLGDYGGPTETMALLPGSPAIHNGTAVSGVTTDQRGFPMDSPPDIGAFQSQPGPLVVDTAIDGLGSPFGELSLRQAVNLADVLTGGATITFSKPVFSKPTAINLTAGQLELSNPTGPIEILGPGLGMLAISGGGASRVFQVDKGPSAMISGLTITGGVTTGNGGGVLNLGTLTLSGDAVVGDVAENGGGVANAGTLTILDSSIDGDFALGDGGGIDNTGALDMILSDLSANLAGVDGGGLYDIGTATLVLCTVDDNAATAGGGIYVAPPGRPVVLDGTVVKGNQGGNTFGRVIQL